MAPRAAKACKVLGENQVGQGNREKPVRRASLVATVSLGRKAWPGNQEMRGLKASLAPEAYPV